MPAEERKKRNMDALARRFHPPTRHHHQRWSSFCSLLHGDDNVALGSELGLDWYRQQVRTRFIFKLRAYFVPGGQRKRRCQT